MSWPDHCSKNGTLIFFRPIESGERSNSARFVSLFFSPNSMSGLTIYHNTRCSKSRNALAYLEQEEATEVEVCQYQKTPPSTETLKKLAEYLGLFEKDDATRPWDVLLRPEARKKLSSWDEVWPLLQENPALLERPFVIDWDNKKAAIGRSIPGHADLLTVEDLIAQRN
ncbi:hypothetical protein BC940DRAFT_293475 [Gongronella butleri]|nr:hypothetical protein BC940DRAFT_293475 [Gongronella butleri]